jgi:lysophospholipase L1-like esterase
MQATHGSVALSRSRIRLIGYSLATILALLALVLAFASNARAEEQHEEPEKSILAAGDSLTFGYSTELFNENFPTEPPKAFETATNGKPNGFVRDYFEKLVAEEPEETESNWRKPVNDGCPGETTDSFIGNGPLGAALAGLGAVGAAPCAYHNVNGLRLHHEYLTGQSQLENSLETIRKNQSGKGDNHHPVVTVSLQIGSNDLLHGVAKCEAEVKSEFEKTGKSIYGGPSPEAAVKGCLEAHAGEIFQHVLKNTGASLFAIRNGSLFGGVNYSGKIIVLGFYDPNGAVFTPGVELLPSSNTLLAILNFFDGKLAKEFGACYANPQPRFNPLFEGKPAEEPARLQAFTNMANTTTAKNGNKAKNGPDIHPTQLGYEELANIMKTKCP